MPTPFVLGSVALHALAGGLVVARPSLWTWAASVVVLDHLFLTACGLWPRSSLLGPNVTRLPEAAAAGSVAITIDDGPDPEVTPAVLDILDRHQAKATFFCVGERVTAQPVLAQEIVRRGHSIENHSERHRHNFSLLGPRGLAAEISEAQRSITAVTGEPPRFFRAPAGLRNVFLDAVLQRLDLRLVSWTRRGFDTVETDGAVVLARLARRLAAGDILLVHDGHAARTASGTPVVLEVLPALLDRLQAAGLRTIRLRSVLR